MKFKDKVVWITGASGGIGAALALAFAREGARLVLHDQSPEKLEGIRKSLEESATEYLLLAFDLTAKNDYGSFVRQVTERFGRIDVLINNAGISQRALAHETTMEVDRKILEINYFSATELTRQVLPVMLSSGGGSVAATSSISGLFGFPLRSSYAASKHAVSGYFETLGLELRSRGIYVTIAYPGRIRTDISLHSLQKDGRSWNKMDRAQQRGLSPEACARKYMKAIYRKKRTVYIGNFELLMAYIKRYCPPLFYLLASRVRPT